MRSLYVETLIRAPLDELWTHTQEPELHESWDLRFTEIRYLPRPDPSQPQRFLYATRIGLGLDIRGEGESIGTRDGEKGERTSALKFWSDDPKSLIREGSGYWKYVPTDEGVRFLTDYNYRTRFGAAGRAFDALIFRPLLHWATAWSFDRLRLWLEKGIAPAASLDRAFLHALARIVLAFVWLYQGIVPKLLYEHADELLLLRQSGVPPGSVLSALHLLGWAEVALGALFLWPATGRLPFVATLALMAGVSATVAVASPGFLVAAFNPVTLNVLMAALALVGLLSSRDAPSARRCLRRSPEPMR